MDPVTGRYSVLLLDAIAELVILLISTPISLRSSYFASCISFGRKSADNGIVDQFWSPVQSFDRIGIP